MKKYTSQQHIQESQGTKKPNSLIVNITQTYLKCNSHYPYKHGIEHMRPLLTEPSEGKTNIHSGVDNDGYDNVNSDYIFRKGDVIINQKKKIAYQISYLLGKGTFGQVLCCRNEKGEKVAIKVIKNKQNYQKQAMFEAKILKTLNKYQKQRFNQEERVVVMLDVFMWRKHLCIVFQYLERSLYDLLKQGNFEGINLIWIQEWSKQIIEGLFRIHQQGIIHCDLKPQNIMFKKQKMQQTLTIIDFGSSCFQKEIPYKYIQSRFYRAPEVILGLDYSTKIDMWSLGCILVELYIGLPLFPGNSSYDMLRKITAILGIPDSNVLKAATCTDKYFNLKENRYQLKTQKQFQESNSIELPNSKNYYNLTNIRQLKTMKTIDKKDNEQHQIFLDFIERLLQFDPKQRISSKQALQHRFLVQSNVLVQMN